MGVDDRASDWEGVSPNKSWLWGNKGEWQQQRMGEMTQNPEPVREGTELHSASGLHLIVNGKRICSL
jgi:hypothetical protein